MMKTKIKNMIDTHTSAGCCQVSYEKITDEYFAMAQEVAKEIIQEEDLCAEVADTIQELATSPMWLISHFRTKNGRNMFFNRVSKKFVIGNTRVLFARVSAEPYTKEDLRGLLCCEVEDALDLLEDEREEFRWRKV